MLIRLVNKVNNQFLKSLSKLLFSKCKNIVLLGFILSLSNCSQKHTNTDAKVCIKEEANGYILYKNNEKFIIKGAAGFSYLKELKEAGGNTLRTYDTTNLGAILDSANKYGLSVMVGLPMIHSKFMKEFYEKEELKNKQILAFKNVIKKYKDHPALLIWCLGNEIDFPITIFKSTFYGHFNALVEMVHQEDQNHPVTTTLIKRRQVLSLLLRVSSLDFISINVFGKISTFKNELEDYNLFWKGPFLISEWGVNGYWETEKTAWDAPIENTSTKNSEIIKERYKSLIEINSWPKQRCIGSIVFFWGEKQEKTGTWFSMFIDNGKKSSSVIQLSELWTGKKIWEEGPKLKYMLLNKKGAKDNIMVLAGSLNNAEILQETMDSTIIYKWGIYNEELQIDHNRNTLTQPLNGLIFNMDNSNIIFKAPSKEGAYRVAVKVFDRKGNCSTVNTPFYVLENDRQTQ